MPLCGKNLSWRKGVEEISNKENWLYKYFSPIINIYNVYINNC